MGKIISIFNQKGGVGKTTSAINLASYIAQMGYKVLLIDIDPQGNTTSGLGIEKDDLEYSMYDVIIENAKEENFEVVKDAIVNTVVENLYILPSRVELAGAEIEITYNEYREKILKRAIKSIKNDYDYIFIDCPPSLGLLTINALTAADSVLIPIQCEFYALEGVGQLMNTINLVKKNLNPDLKIQGVIMSMFDGRTNLSIEVVEEVKKYFKGKVYTTIIPRNIKLAEAPSHGLPIMLYDKNSTGAKAYKELAEEFIELERDEQNG
ncbi:ParA family protein [Caloramator australicus]|uniref:Sporulation initiation inhibitor protein Soj n=1 Tax=Caloramator australicus RC3 TaxID=857293 RepID=I7KVK3_9CLOT|nr:AAA family ATPase [Caloramator australicus]CCJ34064.1 Chromosome (plasmid) partitioning protein ParA / Sporulation initiation inhibitor protein Soj [Caloramator australicus RC3]